MFLYMWGLCKCVCVCAHMCVGVHIHRFVWRSEVDKKYPLGHSPLYFLRQDHSLNLELAYSTHVGSQLASISAS